MNLTGFCCLYLLVLCNYTRLAAASGSRPAETRLHRALLSTDDSTDVSSTDLYSASGPGLWAAPASAFVESVPTEFDFLSATAPAQDLNSDSKSGCPFIGKLIASSSSSAGLPVPVHIASSGNAIVWGSTERASGPDSSAVGTVYFLQQPGTCDYSYSTPLPDPTLLLPPNYQFQPGSNGGAPFLSQIASSASADVLLAAAAQPATFTAPAGLPLGSNAATALPYTLAVISYKRVLKPGAFNYSYMPAAVLPVPALAMPNGTVSGLSMSRDGRTALVCLMPRCGNANPSSCGAGAAHIFRLVVDSTATLDVAGGHQWSLVATLPFSGPGSPVGHGVSCSLSPDGTTAAVLSGVAVSEPAPVPVTFTVNAENTGSSGGKDRRLLQQFEVSSVGADAQQLQFATVAPATRSAYLQLYALGRVEGAWASVGGYMLNTAVAECILGSAPCRPVIDVTEKFATVAYRDGPQLKVEVLYHTARQAAQDSTRCEFTEICTLSRVLARQLTGANVLDASGASADLIAGVVVRQPPGTLVLKVQVTTRIPGSEFLWTLSRRDGETCPAVANSLLEGPALNAEFAVFPQLNADLNADGNVVVVSGVSDEQIDALRILATQ